MTTPEQRVREQIVHDLEQLYAKRETIEPYDPPIWTSFRFIGLMIVFVAALFWYTRTEMGLTAGMVLFIVGAILIMVPRGANLAAILRWDGGLKDPNQQVESKNLDEQIKALERALETIDNADKDDKREPAS